MRKVRLTPKQEKIADLLEYNLTYQQIQNELGVSSDTISRTKKILKKAEEKEKKRRKKQEKAGEKGDGETPPSAVDSEDLVVDMGDTTEVIDAEDTTEAEKEFPWLLLILFFLLGFTISRILLQYGI